MREVYIRQVKKELLLPKRQKQMVLGDLEEIFASAAEHGEPEGQVMERLGSPSEFARNTEEQFGVDYGAVKRRRRIIRITLSGLIAAAALLAFGMIQLGQGPDNVIGQADAMTGIQIQGVGDPSLVLLLAGLVAAVLTCWQLMALLGNHRRNG